METWRNPGIEGKSREAQRQPDQRLQERPSLHLGSAREAPGSPLLWGIWTLLLREKAQLSLESLLGREGTLSFS